MKSNNGGLIGQIASISTLSASGVWSMGDIYTASTNSFWVTGTGVVPPAGLPAYGWNIGGRTTATVNASTIDRIDQSNDDVTASVRGPMPLELDGMFSFGTYDYGWAGGGFIGGGTSNASRVYRITYTNDLASATSRSTSASRGDAGSFGNSTYGWYGGGGSSISPPYASTIYRYTYASDTAASRPATLTIARANLTGSASPTFGYFQGGTTTGSSNPQNRVDRIDLSNDVSGVQVGQLSLARWGGSATGNNNYGWIGGGFTNVFVSTVDRIDYSNDSQVASGRAPLSAAKHSLSATTSYDYGWFGGGVTGPSPSFVVTSVVNRIVYASDTSTIQTRGALSLSRGGLSGTSNGIPLF
jgi:hypothetical protein